MNNLEIIIGQKKEGSVVGKFIQELFMKGLHWWYSNKNSPANAGHKGSIPGPGRFHTQESK